MVLKTLIPTWGALGFYRGGKLYNYEYKKQYSRYEELKDTKNCSISKPKYFYTGCIASSFIGCFLYINPLTVFLIIPKEIYRIEVNIRGLHDEKEKDSYYNYFLL